MNSLTETLKDVELVTFDCYGTLIDWNSGIGAVIRRVIEDCGAAGRIDPDEMLRAYVPTEAAVESQTWRPYRRVLSETLLRLAERFNLSLLPEHRDLLAASLPEWRPFPDTGPALMELSRRFRLGILSNVDRDLFEGSARQLPVQFEPVITAQDVRAYKPAHPHFLAALAHVGGDRTRLLHVAESAYHDGAPAGHLGIPWVWINRTQSTERHGASPIAEFADLGSFAAAIR